MFGASKAGGQGDCGAGVGGCRNGAEGKVEKSQLFIMDWQANFRIVRRVDRGYRAATFDELTNIHLF